MDADELRRSQRRYKKGGNASSNATPSQESDLEEDEEDVSTPSADHADRNIMSSLSVR